MSDKTISTEELLRKFRKGYKETFLEYGDFKVPLKILNADEENKIILEVKQKLKAPNEQVRAQHEPLAIMKEILFHSAFVDNVPGMTRPFLDALSSIEIEKLYDQYLEKCHQINPELEDLSREEVAQIIADVKKNSAKANDLSTRELKAIGNYFLEVFLPMARELGSN